MHAAKTAPRSRFLTDVEGTKVYLAATGLKLGTRGRVTSPRAVLADLDKGSARRVRKALRRVGRHDLVLASLS